MNKKVKRVCQCKDVLVIENDPTVVKSLFDAVYSIDQYGVDSAVDIDQALSMLTSKLQAQCCRDSYDIIVLPINEQGIKTLDSILETVDLWNQKLTAKGRPNISPPVILGLSTEDSQNVITSHNIYGVIDKPIMKDKVVRLVEDIRC